MSKLWPSTFTWAVWIAFVTQECSRGTLSSMPSFCIIPGSNSGAKRWIRSSSKETKRLHELNYPVLVGTTSVDASETLSKLFSRAGLPHNVLNAKYHQREAEIVAGAGQPGAITIATNMAGRGTDIKLGPGVTEARPSRVKDPDGNLVDVTEAGGLHIIGSERHEARRIDRQLRGRAGRQGDPGSSQFFLSLEDDLMRLFGSELIARLMDWLGVYEGEMFTHSFITCSI